MTNGSGLGVDGAAIARIKAHDRGGINRLSGLQGPSACHGLGLAGPPKAQPGPPGPWARAKLLW